MVRLHLGISETVGDPNREAWNRSLCLNSCLGMQLQKDGDWETRVDAAFCKLDSNGDGYIDLEELLAQLPFESEESYDGERLMEVRSTSENLPFALFRTLLFF